MPIYFVDSSALVKRYQYEAGSDRVSQLFDQADQLWISRLAHVEVIAALVRRARATSTPHSELDARIADFNHDLHSSFDIIELNFLVLERTIEIARRHALRAADAIQLSCATLAHGQIAPSEEFIVLGSDQELNNAAKAEALSVLDPTQ